MNDCLLEIGCEELPAIGLKALGESLAQLLQTQLHKAGIGFADVNIYTTPRRLAYLLTGVAAKQQDQLIQRRGPLLTQAYQDEQQPTSAAQGFARSCGVPLEQLTTISSPKGECLYFEKRQIGAATPTVLPELVKNAVQQLTFRKSMRWGNSKATFLRPVQWLILLWNHEILPLHLFGLTASNQSQAHRVLATATPCVVPQAKDYAELLQQEGFVIASWQQRLAMIKQQIDSIARQHQATACYSEALIEEITGLVEWPCALSVAFDAIFLQLPVEVLSTSLAQHQKAITLKDHHGQLLPHCIVVSNIQSKEPETVIAGNAKVIKARLSDALFFYQQDKTQSLVARLKTLEHVTFHAKLGNLKQKVERLSHFAQLLAVEFNVDPTAASRAALLSKSDLTTHMVGEFPELQGTMGYYYAHADNEPEAVAVAIGEHYRPAFAGDELPSSPLGQVVALADKLDNLLGLTAALGLPKGDKDPYALRRAAYGVLHILLKMGRDVHLTAWLPILAATFEALPRDATQVVAEVSQFIKQRQMIWYKDNHVPVGIIQAVFALNNDSPVDVDRRVQALTIFAQTDTAKALSSASRRVHNILQKQKILLTTRAVIDHDVLIEPAEKNLVSQLTLAKQQQQSLLATQDYAGLLAQATDLKPAIDAFFDNVMVMAEDKALRLNRLAVLQQLQSLFQAVADLSLLQQEK